MPAKERGDQICRAEDIEAAAKDGAGDAVQRRERPAQLWAIDSEMGGYGSVEALGGEDGVCVGCGCALGCCGSLRIRLVRELMRDSGKGHGEVVGS